MFYNSLIRYSLVRCITITVHKLLEYWSTGEQLHVLYIKLYMKYVFFSCYVQYSIILISKRKFSVLWKPVKSYTIFERPIRYGTVPYGTARREPPDIAVSPTEPGVEQPTVLRYSCSHITTGRSHSPVTSPWQCRTIGTRQQRLRTAGSYGCRPAQPARR